MKRSNDLTLKEAIGELLKAYRLEDKFAEHELIQHWEELMGKMISNRTLELFIKDKKLFLRIDSSVLKSELMMMKSSVLQRVNERAGRVIAEELVIL
jgi:predicted nucleic acid-binding Zn ribbon protein